MHGGAPPKKPGAGAVLVRRKFDFAGAGAQIWNPGCRSDSHLTMLHRRVGCKLTSIFARDSKIMQRGEAQKMLFRPSAAWDGLMRVRANKYYPCEIVTYVYGDIFEFFKGQILSKFYAD